jgi:RimJ/RimL family protein N-acetyltransferase
MRHDIDSAATGATADLQPHLSGDLVELRPLVPEDWDGLFAVASDPKIWEQHPQSNRYQPDVFRQFFQNALDSGGALVAIDRATQRIIGSSRFVWHDKPNRTIEIGWTFLACTHWGGRYNGEMKRLMIAHAFGFADRIVFIVGPDNRRSRKAVERIGATLTDRRERGTAADGRAIEQVVYEISNPLRIPSEGPRRASL